MADLNITAAVVVSTENAEAGFDRIGDKAERMATDVAGAAGKAGAAVDKIGDGAAKGAENFTRSESRIRDSIKRTTQDLNLLGKTASEKLEFKINDKGLDLSKFSGYIDELKKAEQAQLALSAASANAGAAASGSLNKIGISAAQTANALRGVPAQFTDIVVSLQGGQAPLTVFLQQGGQLKDMFGGAGNAARALGGYVVGLINPFTVAAAAAGALGLAYFKGSQEATEFSKALILSGNASGATAGQLQGFAQAISKVTGTQGAAAAALAEFAASGKVGADNLQRFTQAAVQFEKATGTAVSETVKQFAELGKAPVEASVKLNEQINYLTVSVYKQIKALEDQGRATEAADLAQKTFSDTIASRAGQIVENVGYIEGAWKAVKSAISEAVDAAKSVGRAPTDKDRIDAKRSEIGRIETLIGAGNLPSTQAVEYQTKLLEQKKQELEVLSKIESVKNQTAKTEAAQAATAKDYAEFIARGAQFETNADKLKKELQIDQLAGQRQIAAGTMTQIELDKRLSKIREKYKESAGPSKVAEFNDGINAQVEALKKAQSLQEQLVKQSVDKLGSEYKRGLLTQLDYINQVAEAEKKVLTSGVGSLEAELAIAAQKSKSKKEVAALEGALAQAKERIVSRELAQGRAVLELQAKVESDRLQFYNASINSSMGELDSLTEKNKATRFEIEAIGLTGEALARLTDARLADAIAAKEQKIAAMKVFDDSGTSVDAILLEENKLAQMREARTLASTKITRQAATAEWKKFSDSVYTGLTDSLYRAFESGKGFFKSFWDGIRNLFKTTVLKLAIQGVVTGVTGSLGFSGAANASGGGSSAGGFDFSSITNPMTSLSNAFTKFAGSSTGQSLGLSNSSAIAGNNPSAFAPVGTQLTSTGSAMGTALGVVGDTLAGYAMGSMARSLISDGYSAGKGMDTFQKVGIAVGSAIGGPLVGAAIGAGAGVFNRLFGRKLDDTGIQGTFGGMRGFEGNSFEKYKGGFFRSDKTNTSALAEDARAALGDAFGLIRVQVGTFATALGLDADRISGFTSAVSLSLKGLDPKAAEAKIQEALANAGNQLASSFDTGGFAKAGETSLITLERLATSISAVNGAFSQMDVKLLAVGLAGADSASKLIDATGGLQAFTTQISSYYENFYSEAERTAKATQNLTGALGALGVDALPASREAFRKLLEAQDVTTESGRGLYAGLLQLSGAFAQLTPVTESIAEAYKRLTAVVKTSEQIAQERIGLQGNLNALTDTSAQALTRQRDALDGSNRALFDQVQALERAKSVAAERSGLEQQLNALTDTSTQALTRQRDALDASNQSLFDQIQAINAARALAEAAQAAFDSSKVATTNALMGVQRAIDAEKTRIGVMRDAARESASSITSVFTLLRDQIEQLYSTVSSSSVMQVAQGNEFISQAISAAQTTGALPDQRKLGDAISAARGGLDANQFATQFEADRAALVMAGKLSQLKDLAVPQLSVAEQALKAAEAQLTALDKQMEFAQQQVDALNGIDTRVLSVKEAIDALAAAILAQKSAIGAVVAPTASAYVAALPKDKIFDASVADPRTERDKAVNAIYASTLGRLADAGGLNDWSNSLLSIAEIASGIAASTEATMRAKGLPYQNEFNRQVNKSLNTGYSIPAFAVGTNYVPRDMLAQIHEGEAIVPRAYNPAAGGAMGSGNTERLERLVEGLTLEVQRLQAVVATGNANTRRTADAVNGNPEVPMLVQTV